MITELDFYRAKLAIAKAMYGKKAVTDAQFAKCHTAALNVFDAIGTPAYTQDEVFMGRHITVTYVDKGKHYTHNHEIRTALDMFETGLCDEVWVEQNLGIKPDGGWRKNYILRDGQVVFKGLKKEAAVYMWLARIAERLGK